MNGKTTGSSTQTELVDIEWVARRLGVTVRHVRRLVGERRIPFVKWGHLLRFDPIEIEAWINGLRRPPAAGRDSSFNHDARRTLGRCHMSPAPVSERSMTSSLDRPGPTRRAIDELIRHSGARPVASIDDLSRFRASLWDSDEELDAFLANVRASRAGYRMTISPVVVVDTGASSHLHP